jgi:hypothetical protein
MRRPYLADDGSVFLALPKPLPWLRELSDDSKLLYAVLHGADQLGARFGATVEREIAREGSAHAGFRHSATITQRLLRHAASRAGSVPFLVFSADGREPYYAELQRIAREEGIRFVPGVPEAVTAAEREGRVARDCDRAHWNELGHELCAHVLEPAVRAALEHPDEAARR